MEYQKFVFVGNIPEGLSNEELESIFSQVGQVVSIQLIRDADTNEFMGYGFFEYASEEIAMQAVQKFNGFELQGNILCVERKHIVNTPDEELPRNENKLEDNVLSVDGNDVASTSTTEVQIQIHEDNAYDAVSLINNTVATLSPEQMLEILKQMQGSCQKNSMEMRKLLQKNPQLSYALVQILVAMKVMDQVTANGMLLPEPHLDEVPLVQQIVNPPIEQAVQPPVEPPAEPPIQPPAEPPVQPLFEPPAQPPDTNTCSLTIEEPNTSRSMYGASNMKFQQPNCSAFETPFMQSQRRMNPFAQQVRRPLAPRSVPQTSIDPRSVIHRPTDPRLAIQRANSRRSHTSNFDKFSPSAPPYDSANSFAQNPSRVNSKSRWNIVDPQLYKIAENSPRMNYLLPDSRTDSQPVPESAPTLQPVSAQVMQPMPAAVLHQASGSALQSVPGPSRQSVPGPSQQSISGPVPASVLQPFPGLVPAPVLQPQPVPFFEPNPGPVLQPVPVSFLEPISRPVPPPIPASVPMLQANASMPINIDGTNITNEEKINLIMKILELTDEEISQLSPEQRANIFVLKEQIYRKTD